MTHADSAHRLSPFVSRLSLRAAEAPYYSSDTSTGRQPHAIISLQKSVTLSEAADRRLGETR